MKIIKKLFSKPSKVIKTWDNTTVEELKYTTPLDSYFLVKSMLKGVEKGLSEEESKIMVNTHYSV